MTEVIVRRPGFRRVDSVVETIGQTPLVRLRRLEKECPGVELYAKLEYRNPGGSVKDRPALQIVQDALASGRLTKDKILIDATSGNTGVAYSLLGAAMGFPVTLVMPSNVTQARKLVTRAFGTQIVSSSPMEGSDGAIRLCKKLVEENPDRYFYADQYSNDSNWRAHYLGTGVELLEQLGDKLTHFVTGVGTSGTIMGTTRRLHERTPRVHCIAAEPAEALHGLEGLKHMASSIVPAIWDPGVPDEIMPIGTEDGWNMADRLAHDEALHVGHSSGANVFAALQVAKRIGEGCVATVLCDRGDRYFAPMRWEKFYEW
ncbi:MAG: cysteine synthase family protein [Deltaproteobacteria bacterium]|nr:cysteine synthase family protein [Deltaproteobacteria bacterium]